MAQTGFLLGPSLCVLWLVMLWLRPIQWEPTQNQSLLSRYPRELIKEAPLPSTREPVERIRVCQVLSAIYWCTAQREPSIEEVAANISSSFVDREELMSRRERYVIELCESVERGENSFSYAVDGYGWSTFVSQNRTGDSSFAWHIVLETPTAPYRLESVFAESDDRYSSFELTARELNRRTQSWLLALISSARDL
jgi:hypothetical protein